ncbi:MAG: YchJ family metal-binding protein, partial [Pseudomonadota bacterium]|nr:YchJ family metal-binding protein [Pseudomonadota bacterium]
MRSRFSAYATENFDYVLKTYSKEKQQSLSVDVLKNSAEGANWFALKVNATPTEDTVEFTAYYFENKAMYQLHESSRFIQEDGAWR